MPSPSNNVAIIAVAGARKTEAVIEGALGDPSRRVLITTYTNENLNQIARRIQAKVGVIPAHISIRSWFSFLLSEGIRPYQHAVFGEVGLVRGLDFQGKRNQFAKKETRGYFLDRHGDVYKDAMADLACHANERSSGSVVARLEAVFDQIYIDEMQDLVGYDLDFLQLLLESRIDVTAVGDPRQFTLATNQGSRNKKYRGAGLVDWLDERTVLCRREDRSTSARCSEGICEFASALFPNLPPLDAEEQITTGHDGVHTIEPHEVHAYVETYRPVVLRDSKTTDTLGQPAMNIGVAKGSTFDRVLIFPTKPMKKYLADGDSTKLRAPERLYVAVTRARYSAAFVV
jgi:hypothetical protein